MFKLYRVDRVDRDGRKPKAVYIGERSTINKARKFLAQRSDAGAAGVFFDYGAQELVPFRTPQPDPHANRRPRRIFHVATTGRPGPRPGRVSQGGAS